MQYDCTECYKTVISNAIMSQTAKSSAGENSMAEVSLSPCWSWLAGPRPG